MRQNNGFSQTQPAVRNRAEAGRERLSFLVHASTVLADSLDYQQTVDNIADLTCPHLADWCSVFVVRNNALVFRVDRAPWITAEHQQLKRELSQYHTPRSNLPNAVSKVIETGEPIFFDEVPEAFLQELAVNSEHHKILQALNPRSYMVVPMMTRGSVLGAIALATIESKRTLETDDLVVMQELARRGAQALENCRLYQDVQQSKESLRASNDRLNALFQSSPLPIVSIDVDGYVQEWNPEAESVFGYTREEVIGRPLAIVPQGRWQDFQAELRDAYTRGTIYRLTAKRQRKDGGMVDADITIGPLHDADNNIAGFVAIYLDVTERTRFLQVGSHELRNPVAAIKALASLLRIQSSRGEFSNAAAAKLAILDREIDRLTYLLNQVFEAFLIEEGHLDVSLKQMDVCSLVRSTVETFRLLVPERDFCLSHGELCPIWVLGDEVRLGEVLRNLLDNAIKYSDPDKPVTISLTADDQWAEFAVTDQGIGIAPDQKPHIFNCFYRGPNVERSQTAGMGLGLYVARETVRNLGGEITVESQINIGSTFRVRLPLHIPDGHLSDSPIE